MLTSILLGLIQGLTEFLPVSSSAHVLFFEKVLHAEGTGKTFAAAIHLATALAAIVYFRKDIWNIKKSFLARKNSSDAQSNRRLGYKIVLATIPIIILGFIIEKIDFFTRISENLYIIGISLILFSILLYFADRINLKNERKSDISYTDSLLIGASQIIAAIFPGASRSGMTLTTSFWRNIDRELAAKFVFLIAIPATALPGLYEIIIKKNLTMSGDFLVAFISAFLSGLAAIYILLKLISNSSLKWFCLYRILLGIIILAYASL